MATIKLRNGIELSDFGKPYFVAELNTSHFGDLETARQMIVRAREVGCDCVKFQSVHAKPVFQILLRRQSRRPPHGRQVRPGGGQPARPGPVCQVGRNCVRIDALLARGGRIPDRAVRRPFHQGRLDGVEQPPLPGLHCPHGNTDGAVHRHGELGEIRAAVETIANAGNRNLCVLHCVSTYPAAAPAIRLNNILGLRDEFPEYPIGYSDHSLGLECAAASVALGACLIEKHFTLDHNKLGMDNQMATEPAEMMALVQACRNVHEAMGSRERILPRRNTSSD